MFYKILYSDMKCCNHTFREGLNSLKYSIRNVPFQITDRKHVLYWAVIFSGNLIGDVVVPDKCEYVEQGLWKTNQLILSNVRSIEDFVEELTKEELFEAVRACAFVLKYVRNQTSELCKVGVKQNGMALQYVRNQTPELCKLAVQQLHVAFEYVRCQTPELCELAVRRNGFNIQYVKKKTPYLCKLAVKQNSNVLVMIPQIRENLP